MFIIIISVIYYHSLIPKAFYNLSTKEGPPKSRAALNISPILHFKFMTSSCIFSIISDELSWV